MDKITYISSSEVEAAYNAAKEIWWIPPYEAVLAAATGTLDGIIEYTKDWLQPFRGPKIEIVNTTEIRTGLCEERKIIRITTDTSERVITITFRGSTPRKIEFEFKNGSIFAAGDLYSRILRAVPIGKIPKVQLTDGSNRDPDFPTFAGMARCWGIAQQWEAGELSEKQLEDLLLEEEEKRQS